MSKMLALGIILSAKDLLSPVMKKGIKSIHGLEKQSEALAKKLGAADKKLTPLARSVGEVTKELKDLQRQKLDLREKFRRGEISAEQFERKLSMIDRKEKVLGSRKLRLDRDLKRGTAEANRLNRALESTQRRIRTLERLHNFQKYTTWGGTGLIGAGVITRGMSEAPIAAYTRLEEAQVAAENAFRLSTGKVSKHWADINRQALELGNKLPGTTADFYAIATTLKRQGISDESIKGGVLKSSAYLAVVLKQLGVSYEESAMSSAKFKQALKIADKEMLSFMDDIQRMVHMGSDLTSLRYAFSKIGPTLESLGWKGLRGARMLEPIVAILQRKGFSGELIGTNFGRALQRAALFNGTKAAKKLRKRYGLRFNFTDRNGRLISLDKMIAQLERKLKRFSAPQRLKILQTIFGTGEGLNMMNALVSEGIEGYRKTQQEMRRQADINQRVNASLSTLSAMWEAFTGTMENVLAIIGKNVSPTLKKITTWLGEMADKLTRLSEEWPRATKLLSYFVVGASTAATVIGGLLLSVGVMTRAFRFFVGPLFGAASALETVGVGASGAAADVAKLNKKVSWSRRLFASPLKLTVTLIGAAAVIAGLDKIAEAAHRNISDKRIAGKSVEKLKEQLQHVKERIADATGKNGTLSKWWESFTGGSNDDAKIKALIRRRDYLERMIKKAAIAAPVVATAAAAQTAYYPPKSPYEPSPVIKRAYEALQNGGVKAEVEAVKANVTGLQSTVQAIANRPEQHTYHVQVTVNGTTASPAEIQAAVTQALQRSHAQKQTRSMRDEK